MNFNVFVPAGIVVGIGKLKIFVTSSFPFEIPTLSFLVAKTGDGNFVSTCIQLMIDGEGETPTSAINSLKGNVLDYLKTLFGSEYKDSAWDSLHDLFNDDFSNSYWKAYRDIQLNLAQNGISTDSKSALYELINKLQKQISDLEEVINKDEKDISVKVVDYQEPAA